MSQDLAGAKLQEHFRLTKWDGDPPRPGEHKVPTEIIEGVNGRITRVLRPVNGVMEEVAMLRVRAPFSMYNGFGPIAAGEAGLVSAEQAKRAVLMGGELVNERDEPLALIEAVRLLKIAPIDLPKAVDEARRKQIAAAIIAAGKGGA